AYSARTSQLLRRVVIMLVGVADFWLARQQLMSSPRRFAHSRVPDKSARSWSAAVLCRFGLKTKEDYRFAAKESPQNGQMFGYMSDRAAYVQKGLNHRSHTPFYGATGTSRPAFRRYPLAQACSSPNWTYNANPAYLKDRSRSQYCVAPAKMK